MRQRTIISGLKVDKEDEYLLCLAWHLDRDGYARHNEAYFEDGVTKYESYGLHRIISGAIPGEVVDHINGDRLDNRRSNLRFVTAQENAWNIRAKGMSGVRGVHKNSCSGNWSVTFRKDGERHYFGTYNSKMVATAIAREAALMLYPILEGGCIDAWSPAK